MIRVQGLEIFHWDLVIQRYHHISVVFGNYQYDELRSLKLLSQTFQQTLYAFIPI
jgi:hypothetical protein